MVREGGLGWCPLRRNSPPQADRRWQHHLALYQIIYLFLLKVRGYWRDYKPASSLKEEVWAFLFYFLREVKAETRD